MEDQEYGTPSHSIEELEEALNPLGNGRSAFVPDSTLIEQDHEQSQPRQSTREQIPRRRFEIEGGSIHDCFI